jgi:hypothetical protein
VLVFQFYRLPLGATNLVQAINESLKEALGEGASKALRFYVDPSVATRNLAGYTASLRKILLTGEEAVEKKIAAKLYEKLGLPFVEKPGYDLARYVEEAQKTRAR